MRVLHRGLTRKPRQRGTGLRGHPEIVIAPGQRPIAQFVQCRVQVRHRRAAAEQRHHLVDPDRVVVGPQHQQGVEDRQAQVVEIVGGGLDRLPGGGPGRQCGDAARCRLG